MSRWLQNVGTFLEKLDDQAERVAEEKEDENLADDDDDGAGIASILAARGLSETLQDENHEDVVDDIKNSNENNKDDSIGEEDGDEDTMEHQNDDVARQVTESEAPETAVESANNPEEVIADPSDDNTSNNEALTQDGWDEDLSENITLNENNNHTEATENENPEETPPVNPDALEEHEEASTKDTDQISNHNDTVPAETNVSPEDSKPDPEHTGATAAAAVDLQKSPSSAPVSAEIAHPKEKTTITPTAPSTAEAKLPSFLSAAAAPLLSVAAQSSTAINKQPTTFTRKGGKKSPATTTTTTTVTMSAEQQKELRTLRRSVVSLNQQLEAAEAELRAQREELERAAERMEKDRQRQKEEREKERTRHAAEIKVMQQKQEQALKEAKARSDQQIDQIRQQLREVEDKRMQEGGDWNKELVDAVAREKEMGEKLRCVEEEKHTLLNQITILQDQQESLGSRLESLSQTADNAMEREREADQRLDEALTLHAKQLSQRQAREAELERTIAELGQALVQARNQAPTKAASNSTDVDLAKLQSAEHEIESLRNQLQYESQRASSLQAELEELSKERTQDATLSHKQQRQYEREIADLKHKLTQAEGELREYKTDPELGKKNASNDDQENLRQIKQLSEEVLRQREKITNSSSEISALKSRLMAATERANKAETALEAAQSASNDVEVARGMRRRKRGNSPRPETIRSALQLDSFSQNNSTEQLGRALDGLDAFLLQSGKILRYQPLARLVFILYLIMIHLWTFFLIFIHAHGYETVHGDFGGGHGVPHGPHALMNNPDVPVEKMAKIEQVGQNP